MTPAPTSQPPVQTSGPQSRFAKWGWLWVSAGLVGLFVLWRFEPAGQFFYPRCWLQQTTGLQCPGCGTTRALHALLHGNVGAALKFNALAVLGVLLAGWFGLRWLWAAQTGRWWRNPFGNPYVIALLAGIAILFGVVRNLPW